MATERVLPAPPRPMQDEGSLRHSSVIRLRHAYYTLFAGFGQEERLIVKKMKRLSVVMLALVMLLAFVPVITPETSAATSGVWEYEVYDGKATITNYIGTDTVVVVPKKIGDYTVVKIGDSAFSGKRYITSATLPNSITEIGAYAFYNCTRLSSVNIPGKVKTIGGAAFYGCESLRNITIPDSVTEIRSMSWWSSTYGYYKYSGAFEGCTSLESVDIGLGVTYIGVAAFSNGPNAILHCYKDSYAHREAISRRYQFDTKPLPKFAVTFKDGDSRRGTPYI